MKSNENYFEILENNHYDDIITFLFCSIWSLNVLGSIIKVVYDYIDVFI